MCAALKWFVGGSSKEVSPVPIVLYSGDVFVFGGDSRLHVHGMAKVFIAEQTEPLLPPGARPVTALGADSLGTDVDVARRYVCSDPADEEPLAKRVRRTEDGSSHTEERMDPETEQCLLKYLRSHRVNINVRQVYSVCK